MKTIPIPDSMLETLKTQFEPFKDLPDEALEWMLSKCHLDEYAPKEHIFEPNQPVGYMMMVVKGGYAVYDTRKGEEREFIKRSVGDISGVLPFSRLTQTRALARAMETTWMLKFPKAYFTEMVQVSYELTQNLVAVMSDRIRNFSEYRFQTEKLMALGRLSAGLAHELNNPASAIVRNAEELYTKMETTPEQFKKVMSLHIEPEQTDKVNQVMWDAILAHQKSKGDIGFLEREEAKDDLLDWMEDRGVKNAEDVADTFVDFGIGVDDLERIEDVLANAEIGPVLNWFDNRMSLERIVAEIREASGRIASLIKSIKTYTHMDQGQGQQLTDLHDGLRSTVVMLNSKFKAKNIRVEKEFAQDLPKINAYVSELNQVWTNLISNSIDAMDRGGVLTIRTYRDRQFVCVDIQDNGSGIPEDVLTQIWEPFFTTKGIGEGTGMGLDIVKKIIDRHKARVEVTSKPGETIFKLCFDAETSNS